MNKLLQAMINEVAKSSYKIEMDSIIIEEDTVILKCGDKVVAQMSRETYEELINDR